MAHSAAGSEPQGQAVTEPAGQPHHIRGIIFLALIQTL